MKKSIFYLYLLSMSLVLSHASLPDKNKVKSRVEKKDSSFLHKVRSMGRKISNIPLSRNDFTLLHIGITIISIFLLLYFKDNNSLFDFLIQIIIVIVLPLFDTFFLYLRRNDADFSIWWHTPRMIYPFLFFSLLLYRTLSLYEVDSMQAFFKALIYGEGKEVISKNQNFIHKNAIYYLKNTGGGFDGFLFVMYAIGLLLPFCDSTKYPSILDKKEKKTSLDDLSPENKEESKLSNSSSLSPSDRVTGENDSENQP